MCFFALFESSIFASTEVRAPTRTSTPGHACTRGRVHKWSLCVRIARLLFSLYIYILLRTIFACGYHEFCVYIYTLSFQLTSAVYYEKLFGFNKFIFKRAIQLYYLGAELMHFTINLVPDFL